VFDLSYACEKFTTAVYALTGEGSLKERIESAYLSFHPLRVADFEKYPDLQLQYQDIINILTKVEGTPGEGRVPATIKSMTSDEARNASDLILAFCFAVREARSKM
jgi:hypothetical protein